MARRKRPTTLERVKNGEITFKKHTKQLYSEHWRNTNPHSPDFGKIQSFRKTISLSQYLKNYLLK